VVVAGRDDDIFPLGSVTEAYKRLAEIYAGSGAPGSCALVVGEGGHRFYAEEGWSKMEELLAQRGLPASPRTSLGLR